MQVLTTAITLAYILMGVGAWCLSASLVLAFVLAGDQPRPIADKVFVGLYRAGWIALMMGGVALVWLSYH